MRPSRIILGALALVGALAVSGCQNPLDPIDKSDKIQGLTWVEINDATFDQWDSDPEADGMVLSIAYKNEFGDELSFHDKPHNVIFEFWTQKDVGTGGGSYLTRDKLFYSQTINYENSDDIIRIPIEAYYSGLQSVFDFSKQDTVFKGMLVVRVFPPKGDPREELLVAQADTEFYVRPAGESLSP